ncbi:uncharacterized protein LOC128683960 [Plodia interpunctella]|uniref:uncharacterized protein LOC128683960 n=1 Tax=Plodia interpunctella TaxID=58824 RepID=UPI002368E235|nr:uncharacterized protein LOC128683960 [Plodia interpunctella]
MQFYRSKRILNALNSRQDADLSHSFINTTNQQEPIPSTSREENNDDLPSDLYNLYDSDDSVKDPDFLYDSLRNEKRRFSFGDYVNNDSDIDLSEFERVPEITNQTNFMPALLPPIYIATYPNTVIFLDQDQANRFQEHNEPPTFEIDPRHNISVNSAEVLMSKNDRQGAEKKKLKYPLIEETCGNKCNRQCSLFTLEERKTIWENYWNINFESRKSFLIKCIKIQNIKRRKVTEKNPNPKYAKNESRFYFLPKLNEGDENMEEVNVCKNFFLKTLGYKTDAVITEISRGVKRNVLYGEVAEKRGGKKSRLDRDPISNHILSFNPTVSHYRRNNAPLARYLPRTLTLNIMFKDFKSKFPNISCSKEVYRQTLKRMHISFKFPKGDKCADCALFEQQVAECENESVPETLKADYECHKIKADKAIRKYQEDCSQENTIRVRYYSMDLQKVMLLPDMPKVKDSFFLSRLIVFNLTFAPLQKGLNTNCNCVLWHEAWAGRDGNNIVDAFAALLEKQRDVQHLVIWCDNCTSQNKNWILFTSLVILVNAGFSSIETINLKYLTKGHTHMTADSVHGNIETQIKRREAIYDYEDYKDAVQNSRNNLDIVEVQKKYQWVKKRRSPRRNSDDVLNTLTLNSLVDVKFVNGSRNMFYKLDFDDQYKEVDFLVKKFDVKRLPETIDGPRGIKQSKRDGILTKLVPLMPTNRKQFWLNLPVSDTSEDLVSGGQMIEQ